MRDIYNKDFGHTIVINDLFWVTNPFHNKSNLYGTFFSPLRSKSDGLHTAMRSITVPLKQVALTTITAGYSLYYAGITLNSLCTGQPSKALMNASSTLKCSAATCMQLALTLISPALGLTSFAGRSLGTFTRPSDKILWSLIIKEFPKQLLNTIFFPNKIVIPVDDLSIEQQEQLITKLNLLVDNGVEIFDGMEFDNDGKFDGNLKVENSAITIQTGQLYFKSMKPLKDANEDYWQKTKEKIDEILYQPEADIVMSYLK